ncbi:hypothetical protein [Siphonobacter sp.]|uniref:hypothetical protein n=1 Tax=Siphonobacter sp. TaxID=1869184 RepID=UPI003B3A2631
MKSLTIVNRHYPPNPGITGESAWDLAQVLIEKYGVEVHIVHIDRTYDGGGAVRKPVGHTHAVSTIYEGKNSLLRFIAGPLDGFLLIRKARKLKKGPLLVMTSPPLLPFWASLFLKRKNWILWSMDLFPEGFAADGKIKPTNRLYRWILKKSYENAPKALIALGPNQAELLRRNYQQSIPTILLPCGVLVDQSRDETRPDWHSDATKIYLGYAGNVGEAHSAEFLESVIRQFNPEKQQLILALYGTKAERLLKLAEGKPGITLLKNIPRAQLHWLDVQLVSLLPQWTHIAVPSKAVSAICSGSPILFCGSKEADTWELLRDAAWLINTDEELDSQVKQVLDSLTHSAIEDKKRSARLVSRRLNEMVDQAYQSIEKLI